MAQALEFDPADFGSRKPGKYRPIDLVHLAKQTLGDPGLEMEVLIMFEQISRGYLSKLSTCVTDDETAHALHSLKGAALGVGARFIAEMARTAEGELKEAGKLSTETVSDISLAVEETCGYIDGLVSERAV